MAETKWKWRQVTTVDNRVLGIREDGVLFSGALMLCNQDTGTNKIAWRRLVEEFPEDEERRPPSRV
jgi:hypothetical protein